MDATVILVLITAYLLGSIPSGLLLSKAMGTGDIRKIGSGNIGATNALRTGNRKLAALTLLGDLLKGTLAVWIANLMLPEYAPAAVYPPVKWPSQYAALAGFFAVVGHIFPVWLRFKGGKGVATALGVLLGLSPWVFLATAATWLVVFKWKRISSLSALVALALAPVYCYFTGNMRHTLVVLVLAVLIFATHHANITRLIKGEEANFKKQGNE